MTKQLQCGHCEEIYTNLDDIRYMKRHNYICEYCKDEVKAIKKQATIARKKAQRREYLATHKNQTNAARKIWRAANKDKVNQQNRNLRRLAKEQNTPCYQLELTRKKVKYYIAKNNIKSEPCVECGSLKASCVATEIGNRESFTWMCKPHAKEYYKEFRETRA